MIQQNDNASKQESKGTRFSVLVGWLFRKLNLLNRDQKVCHGVTLAQCCAIETLEQRGMITMNQLSREQGVTVSTMTRVVDVLVRDDVFERVGSPDDRRKVCIQLTEKGEGLAQILKKCTEDYTAKILGQIPEDKQDMVIESMELLIKAIDKTNPKCCG